jgi:hypothetical protein
MICGMVVVFSLLLEMLAVRFGASTVIPPYIKASVIFGVLLLAAAVCVAILYSRYMHP